MKNRFYTIMIVPERSAQIRKIRVPSWTMKGLFFSLILFVFFSATMLVDYWYAISQVGENQELKKENQNLRHRVQIVENKLQVIESVVDRMKNFSARLRLMMQLNVSDPSSHPEPSLNPTPDVLPGDQSASLSSRVIARDFFQEQVSQAHFELNMAQLLDEALKTEGVLQEAIESFADKKSFLAALPTMQPAEGYFTSGFGFRVSPFGNRIKMHEGIDIANKPGTPICASADGEVVFSGSKTGYGLTLIINHGYGIETWYAHLKGFKKMKGQKVKRGVMVATLGNSGRVTGPHVHYEVRVHGYPVDPRSYIFEDFQFSSESAF